MSEQLEQIEQGLDLNQAVEAYKSWCYKNGKSFVTPDLSKTETTIHKDKPALMLRCAKGRNLARLYILEDGFVVNWVNWYLGVNYRGKF